MRDEGCLFWSAVAMMLACAGWLLGGAFGWWVL